VGPSACPSYRHVRTPHLAVATRCMSALDAQKKLPPLRSFADQVQPYRIPSGRSFHDDSPRHRLPLGQPRAISFIRPVRRIGEATSLCVARGRAAASVSRWCSPTLARVLAGTVSLEVVNCERPGRPLGNLAPRGPATGVVSRARPTAPWYGSRLLGIFAPTSPRSTVRVLYGFAARTRSVTAIHRGRDPAATQPVSLTCPPCSVMLMVRPSIRIPLGTPDHSGSNAMPRGPLRRRSGRRK
jgi:hypothetical protein